MNIPVEEYPVMASRVYTADECMLWGTTTQVMPIVQVDSTPIGDGKPGPITRKLQKALREMIFDNTTF
jgi:branched-subunit amino acid aminotransferase/4-amino-4-deoxychorismate lyase